VQMPSGSTVPEAFELAVQQLGAPAVLQAEFARARIPAVAAFRKRAAIVYSAELAAYTAIQIRLLLKSTSTHGELLLGISGLVATLLIAYAGCRLAPRLGRFIPDNAIRGAVAIFVMLLASVGWMAIFAWWFLPRFDFTPGQFEVAVLWAFLPMVTAPTLLLGIDPPEGERAR